MLKSLAGMLGLLQRDATAFLHGLRSVHADMTIPWHVEGSGVTTAGISPEQVEALIVARVTARKAKNFAESDRIRKELLDAGIVLEDTAKGTTWRRS